MQFLLFPILYTNACDIFMQNEMGKKKRKISTALLVSHRHKKFTKFGCQVSRVVVFRRGSRTSWFHILVVSCY